MVSTRSQSRGRSPPRNRSRSPARTTRPRSNSADPGAQMPQTSGRARDSSAPPQFRFIPPRYRGPKTFEDAAAEEGQCPTDNLDMEQAEEDIDQAQTEHGTPTNQVDEEEDGDASKIYKAFFEKLTSAQQHALLTGKGLSHFRFPPDPSHNLRSAAPGPGREQRWIVPMRPLDIGKATCLPL
jgi:hypothetical protein